MSSNDDETVATDVSEGKEASYEIGRGSSSVTGKHVLVGVSVVTILLAVIIPFVFIFPGSPTSDDDSNYCIPFEFEGDRDDVLRPFDDVVLAYFDESVIGGYSSADEFLFDLENVAKFQVNVAVKRNIENGRCPDTYQIRGGGARMNDEPTMGMATEDEYPTGDVQSDAGPNAADDSNGISDYGTINQEDDIKEGETMVSDGKRVYAAYGDNLLIWNAKTGANLTNIEMDPIFLADQGYYGRPSIKALAVQDNCLVIIVHGYGAAFKKELQDDDEQPIFYDYLSTRIQIYDLSALDDYTANTDTPQLLASEDVHGSFHSVRIVGDDAHVVTVARIDTYSTLVGPLDVSSFPDVTAEQYSAEAKDLAEDGLIQDFVDKLSAAFISDAGELALLPRISILQTGSQDSASGISVAEKIYGNGLASCVALASSFSVKEAGNDGSGTDKVAKLGLSSTGVFLPTYVSNIYAAPNMLIVAGRGQTWDEETGAAFDTTYLFGLALDGPSTTPHSIGHVDGYVINNHAIDVVGNILRIATTVRPFMFFRGRADRKLEIQEEESTTPNYVILLDMPGTDASHKAGRMTELGRLRIGKPNESFTAVRFFVDIAYAVTSDGRDPLYVLDLSNPANPVELAALDIAGFSSYLHSVNEDNTLLLSVGKEADDEGIVLGIKITLFDVSDPTNPTVAADYVIEEDDVYSHSRALFDFHAIRYVDAIETVIIPVTISDSNDGDHNFRGFYVFDVSETSISKTCEIQHIYGSCSCEYLDSRSILFDGNLTTAMGDQVQSTNLVACLLPTGSIA